LTTKFRANFLLNTFHFFLIFFVSALPSYDLVLVSVKCIDLTKRVKRLTDVKPLALFWGKKPEKFVVLGSKLENGANSDNYVVEVSVVEWFTLPLMLFALNFPKLTS